MSDPFVGEIKIFAGTFAPKGWALCNGQLVQIQSNVTLFSLLGTTYGGDGKSTFALPNLQGQVPVQQGQAAGLSAYYLGQNGGANTVTLTQSQLPAHRHDLVASTLPGTQTASSGQILATAITPGRVSSSTNFYSTGSPGQQLPLAGLGAAGGNPAAGGNTAPHSNMMPYLPLNFIIALTGIYPQRP